LAFNALFCVWFIDSRQLVQEQVWNRVVLAWYVCNMPPSLFFTVVVAQFEEMKVLQREFNEGFVRPMVYLLAYALIQLPLLFVLCACALAPVYAIGDWPASSLAPVLIVFLLSFFSFEGLAQLFSLEATPIIGIIQYVNVWFTAILFNGFAVRTRDVPWPLRLYNFILPLRWLNEGLYYALVRKGPNYAGALPCVNTSNGCEFHCPDSTRNMPCFGITGEQISTSLSQVFDVFRLKDPFSVRVVPICSTFGLLMQLCHMLKLVQRNSQGRISILNSAPLQRM